MPVRERSIRYLVLTLLIPLALSAQAVPGRRGAPPAAPTPTADLASLEGQVFNGLGGNPLRKATVTLNRASSGPMAVDPQNSYSAVADSSGRFVISGIEPGVYAVVAAHTGFLSMEYGARHPGSTGKRMDLGRAQKMTGVDFHLLPQGVVSGRITDEDDDPLEGAQVQIMRLVYDQGRKQLRQLISEGTNDQGEFRLAGIPPGKYYVCANNRLRLSTRITADGVIFSSGPPPGDYAATFFPGATDFSAAAPLVLGPGDQMQGINIRLTRIRTVRVKGRVINNAPVAPRPGVVLNASAGLRIFLQSRGDLSPLGNIFNTAMNADGTFEIDRVPPGPYNLVAVANQGGQAHAARMPVDVGTSDIEGINLAINPGVAVTGQVRFDGNVAGPMPALTVRLTARENVAGAAPPPPAKVDADGNFRFEDVNPEVYTVAIGRLPNYYLKSVRSGSTDVMVSGLDVSSGAAAVELLLGTNPPQVGGSVQNSTTQQPAAGVTVVLIPQEKERQNQSYFYSTTTTDQYGNFSFSAVTPGEYKVYAWEDVSPNAWYDPDFMKTCEGQGESASAREGSPVNLKLTLVPAR